MPVPIAIPIQQLLGTVSTGAALGKPQEETTSTEPTIPFSEVLAKQFFGPSSSILQRTINTPSGKVFAPDEPTPAKPNILATYPQSKDQPWIMSSPMPAGEPQGIMGLPIPTEQEQLKGFETPLSPNFNILNKEDTSYRMQHQPRGPESEDSVRLDNLTKSITGERAGYPDDFYSDKGQRIYAPGPKFKDDEFGIANQESYQIINKVKNKPDEEITIYRAVPNNDKIKDINKGDFVTLSKKYAELHAASGYGEYGNDSGKILEKKVKVKDIYWDQNDVNEFGYFPTKEDKKEKELKEYVAEDNEYWKKDIERANKKYPTLKVENLPKLVEADKNFGAAAMSFENFKESQLIYLNPQEYLNLTKRFGRTDGTLTEGSKVRIENLEKIISEGGELANIPYLYVKKVGDHYEVSGQEGRHRAQAFKNLSYDKIPVIIQGTGREKETDIENKVYTATPRSYLYKEDWAKNYIGFVPNSIRSDDEMVLTKPSDFYDVRTKEKLFPKKEISSNPVGSLIDKPLSDETN